MHNAGKPPVISIFAKIATEHVLGHEIFVHTIWRTLTEWDHERTYPTMFEYVDKAVKMSFLCDESG